MGNKQFGNFKNVKLTKMKQTKGDYILMKKSNNIVPDTNRTGELIMDAKWFDKVVVEDELKLKAISSANLLSPEQRIMFDNLLKEESKKFLNEQSMTNTKRLKVFMDTEFTGLHKNTTLISIGLITETGQTFYAELTDYDKTQCNDDWLQEHVINKLYLQDKLTGYQEVEGIISYEDTDHIAAIGPKELISGALADWFAMIAPTGEQVEIWSDCLSYDWVLFCDLFEHAFNIPKQVYYIPFDICTLFHNANIDPDIDREKFMGVQFLAEHSRKHNALYDARVIKSCYKQLTNINELPFK